MRGLAVFLVTTIGSLLASLPAAAQPGTGRAWDVHMEMEGMPAEMLASMPKQHVCMPKDQTKPPKTDHDCKILNYDHSGDHYTYKAQCPDGLIDADITSTQSSYHSVLKLTDKAGKSTTMNMIGTPAGDCDYAEQKAKIEQMKKDVAAKRQDMERQMAATNQQMAATCDEGVAKMQGQMFSHQGMCDAQKPEFCRRLGTMDGYSAFMSQYNPNMATAVPQYSADAQFKMCKLSQSKVLATNCTAAVKATDFDFVGRFCPAEKPKLCPKAVENEDLPYIADNCIEAKQKLVAEHCAGRDYTSNLEPKYRDFCVRALGASAYSNTGNPAAAETPEEKAKDTVKEGVKNLKHVFGF